MNDASDPAAERSTADASPVPHVGVSRQTARLSDDLHRVVEAIAHRQVTLREMIAILEGRVYTLLLILLALPFCTPIPLPGFSTPFGIVIALLGLRLALGQKPWLPARLLDAPLPTRVLPTVLRAARRLVRGLEAVSRPRMTFLFGRHLSRVAGGLAIMVSGLLLLLPLPIPFTNFFPALTVILIAASYTERDGGMLIAGFAVFGLTALFFTAIFVGGVSVVQWLEDHFSGILDPDYEVPAPTAPRSPPATP